MPDHLWRPASGVDVEERPTVTRARRSLHWLIGAAVLAAGVSLSMAPAAIRNRRENRYCRSEQKAIVANHARLVAAGQPNFFYDEHFVGRQDYMDRCLAVERCQRHGPFGLFHGPRQGCTL